MKAQFAVIGLGEFGVHVARNLKDLGHDVLCIDRNEELVNALADELETVVRADAVDEAALRELRLERTSCSIVAIGTDSVEASILCTMVLRQIGVPQIVARSINPLHARALRAVGAHAVVNPEEEMGARLARRVAQPNVFERIELGGDVELAELEAPSDFVGKTLVELDVRRSHGVSVVAVRRGDAVVAPLDGEERLESGDVLVIVGSPRAVGRMASRA